jgi:hypothetical protein
LRSRMSANDPLRTFVTSSITLLMKLLALTSLLAMSTGATPADPPTRRVPVDVQLVGDDGLSQNLSWALTQRLRRHPHLRPAESSDASVLTIRSDSNVGWDRLDGRLVVIYTVFVGRGDGGTVSHTGICYERQMSKCVNDILRVVSIKAELP